MFGIPSKNWRRKKKVIELRIFCQQFFKYLSNGRPLNFIILKQNSELFVLDISSTILNIFLS